MLFSLCSSILAEKAAPVCCLLMADLLERGSY